MQHHLSASNRHYCLQHCLPARSRHYCMQHCLSARNRHDCMQHCLSACNRHDRMQALKVCAWHCPRFPSFCPPAVCDSFRVSRSDLIKNLRLVRERWKSELRHLGSDPSSFLPILFHAVLYPFDLSISLLSTQLPSFSFVSLLTAEDLHIFSRCHLRNLHPLIWSWVLPS